MATDNYTIIKDIWLNSTSDFMQRIPEPTQSNIAQVMDALFDPMNRMYYNQFIDSLILRIGLSYVHNQVWKNKLSVFKKSKLMYGSTIQEIVPKWIRAHAYVDDAEDVFKMARPDVATWYHSQNRRDRYDITINDTELRTAFTEEFGLNKLVAALLNVPMNSDEYDEYQIMMNLLAIYEYKYGFFKVGLGGEVNTKAIGEDFLTEVRAYAGDLEYPSSLYNAGELEEIPVFAKPEELILLTTPRVLANIDVRNLAAAFNRSDEEIKYRVVSVREIPIPNAIALLTTEDFFMCADTEYRTTSMYNPKTLGTNYYLHHWGVYSVSPFVPAILFTSDNVGTSKTVVTQNLTGINATPEETTVEAGGQTKINVTLTGSITPETPPIVLAPSACTYITSVSRGSDSDTISVNSPATRVDEYGILHVSNKLESGDIINVVCTSTYVNPSGETNALTSNVTVTVK